MVRPDPAIVEQVGKGNKQISRTTALLASAAGTLLAVGLSPAPALAGTISPTPGFFADDFTENGNCSLREAIALAAEDASTTENSCIGTPSGADTVALEAGRYVLDIAGPGAIAQGDLDVSTTNGALTLDGAGAGQTEIDTDDSPAWADRVVSHFPGTPSLTISDLTVTGGNSGDGAGGAGVLSITGGLTLDGVRVTGNTSTGGSGGGVSQSGGALSISDSLIDTNNSNVGGGGVVAGGSSTAITSSVIRNNIVSTVTPGPFAGGIATSGANATTTVVDSVIRDNRVITSNASPAPQGGGAFWFLSAGDTLTVRDSTVSENEVTDPAGNPLGTGGGARIDVNASAQATLVNTTVSGNEAGQGGGLELVNTGPVDLVHTTIGVNEATAGTALAVGGALDVRGSIFDTATASACSVFPGGTITSQGHNVGRDATCGLTGTGDEQNVNPQLGPIQDNGGTDVGPPGLLEGMPTQEPAVTSTAVEDVPAAACTDVPSGPLAADQRGFTRPIDRDQDGVADCDAGSLEVQFPPPSLPEPEPPSGAGEADTAAPDTLITAGPKKKSKKRRARFEFGASEPGSSFECRLDDEAFEPCSSPLTLKVKKGRHTLEVRARDASGNVDPTPAVRSWRVRKN